MKQQAKTQSLIATSPSSITAATIGREEPVEIQASDPEGSTSIDSPGRGGGRRERISDRAARSVPAGDLAPIADADMTKTEASVESRPATTSPSAAAPTDQDHTVDASEAVTPAESSEVQLFQAVEVPLERLVEADWNPNRRCERGQAFPRSEPRRSRSNHGQGSVQ